MEVVKFVCEDADPDMGTEDLRRLAKQRGVPGAAGMSKHQLCQALIPDEGNDLVVMRHGIRIDAIVEGWEQEDGMDRPYDPPLGEYETVHKSADKMVEMMPHLVENCTVVVSPFIRCLQTAAIMCRKLKINTMQVDYDVGELTWKVASTKRDYVPLTREEMQAWAGHQSATISAVHSRYRAGSTDDDFRRADEALVRAQQLPGNVLVVTHGDIVGRVATIVKKLIYDTNEACFVSVRGAEIVHSYRLIMIDDDF